MVPDSRIDTASRKILTAVFSEAAVGLALGLVVGSVGGVNSALTVTNSTLS